MKTQADTSKEKRGICDQSWLVNRGESPGVLLDNNSNNQIKAVEMPPMFLRLNL